jgi:hypothetical protein
MLYSPSHNVALAHYPKTAGTSLQLWFAEAFQDARMVATENKHIAVPPALQLLAPAVPRIIGVLRDPFDMMVSLYEYWRQTENLPANPYMRAARECSFRDFLAAGTIGIRAPRYEDFFGVGGPAWAATRLLDFRALDEGLRMVCREFGLPEAGPLRRENASQSGPKDLSRYREEAGPVLPFVERHFRWYYAEGINQTVTAPPAGRSGATSTSPATPDAVATATIVLPTCNSSGRRSAPMQVRIAARERALLPRYLRTTADITGSTLRSPQRLWVDVPETVADGITRRLDAWLLWMLPHAFVAGSDLVLEGEVSPELLRNAHDIMGVWSSWWPEHRPVRIHAAAATDDETAGDRQGLMFTAGVDSFYTLFHHDRMAREQPECRMRPVDDLVYVWGYDIPLFKPEAFEEKAATLRAIAEPTGKALLAFATNYRQLDLPLDRRQWGPMQHGPALGGMAAFLGRRWRGFLIAATEHYGAPGAWGSSPLVDHHFSTGRTQVRHHGAWADRYEKMKLLAEHDVAFEHLSVCWGRGSARNCSRCEKCFRTMLVYDLLGARHRAATFDMTKFSVDGLRKVWKHAPLIEQIYRDLRERAVSLGRRDVVDVIDQCLAGPAPAFKKGPGRGSA